MSLATMISLPHFIAFFFLVLLLNPIYCYDTSNCSSESSVSGSNYLCKPSNFPCQTYIIYRAQQDFQSLSSISTLFSLSIYDLLEINKMREAESSNNLTLGREIIIPVSCSCPDMYSQVIFMYNFPVSDSVAAVACRVFEGLVKARSIIEENPSFGGDDDADNFMIKVPITCACPDTNQSSSAVKHLVTYPVMKNDHTDLIARKFGVNEEMIWDANNLKPLDSIFPQTTLLVPTDDIHSVNWNIDSNPEDSPSSPKSQTPLTKVMPRTSKSKYVISYKFLGVGLVAVIVLLISAVYVFARMWKNYHPRSFQPLSGSSSLSSNFSPDFLDGMSKLKQSLTSFSLEELRIATDDFNEASKIGAAVYHGKIGDSCVAIEQMNTEEEVRHVIYILTKINHVNIVKLEGYCCDAKPYLVLEFAERGSLRDCLSNAEVAMQLTWQKRIQIAFDLAVGLHYIHYCTKPSFIHCNINSINVLIATDWRAKISGFRLAIPVVFSEDGAKTEWNESAIVDRNGYLPPECLLAYAVASVKVDVFAFGVVLLELLSAKEVHTDGKLLNDSANFVCDAAFEGSSKSWEKLRDFMDPALNGDYPLGDAICLLLLAKACVEQDPSLKPTMNDVLKALSRIV